MLNFNDDCYIRCTNNELFYEKLVWVLSYVGNVVKYGFNETTGT